MISPTVTLTRCSDYNQGHVADALTKQFELLGGLNKFVHPDDSVLIKPNFITPKTKCLATLTHPAVIITLAKLLKDFGAKPFLGDSPSWSNIHACVKLLNLEEPLKKLSVPVKQLGRTKLCRIGSKKMRVGISSVALDADVIINLPKFKTHQQMLTTFAVKNMFGCVSGRRKALWHFRKGGKIEDFCEFLIEIFRFLKPALTIIDGIEAMDGPGPIHGRARPLGWLIGGTEPFAMEMVCAKLVNIEPDDLPIIKTAKKMGLVTFNPEDIKVLGDDFSKNICMDFELPKLIPVKFPFRQICRGICRQILLLAKSGREKSRTPA